jgi:hypothetical protein
MKNLRLLGANTISIYFLLLLFAGTAYAAPVAYDEVIQGDLQDLDILTLLPPTTLLFDSGVNTITGSSFVDIPQSSFDRDQFIFLVPVGLQVTNIAVSSNATQSPGALLGANVSVRNGTSPIDAAVAFLSLDSNGGSITPVSLPLATGSYGVYVDYFTSDNNANVGTINYTMAFTVSSIPIPPALYLFGSGLLGLIGIARKKTT